MGGIIGSYFPGRGTMSEENFLRGVAVGRIDERGSAVLRVLKWRGIPTEDDTRERIRACTSLRVLDSFLEKAFTATEAAELFTEADGNDAERDEPDRGALLAGYYLDQDGYHPLRSGLDFDPGSLAEGPYLRGIQAGRVEERAVNILCTLEARGIPTLARARERITACTDLDVLHDWFALALVVSDAEALFAAASD
ncbi:hypothetical protein AB0O76_36595 [Streptomyces sp. NPDC086554]|uniref:hypothetical protein n=1 Tax=Streptomyces sp. NPDC086554 TaxID=3154864 RepID=UPI00344A8085